MRIFIRSLLAIGLTFGVVITSGQNSFSKPISAGDVADICALSAPESQDINSKNYWGCCSKKQKFCLVCKGLSPVVGKICQKVRYDPKLIGPSGVRINQPPLTAQ